jgi:isopenicillin N synthase-like dioxygenase
LYGCFLGFASSEHLSHTLHKVSNNSNPLERRTTFQSRHVDITAIINLLNRSIDLNEAYVVLCGLFLLEEMSTNSSVSMMHGLWEAEIPPFP